VLEDEFKKCNDNTPTEFSIDAWNNRLSIARSYKAFNITAKRPDLDVQHTLFSAPFVVDSVAAGLPNGLAPNSDWLKRRGDMNLRIAIENGATVNVLDLPMWQTMNDLQCSSKDMIAQFATSIGIKWSNKHGLSRKAMIASIRDFITAQKGIDETEFTKFYPTFRGTTGGIMVVLCTHGVVYYAKNLIGGEGPSDAADAMLTVKAKVFVYDAVGSVVNYMASREPSFFGASKGLVVIPDDHKLGVIRSYLNSSKARLAGKLPVMVSLQELKERSTHTALIDPLHIENSTVIEDRYYRRVELVSGWALDQNHMVQEQIWSRTLKLAQSITQMTYANFIRSFTRNILFNNKQICNMLMKKYKLDNETNPTVHLPLST